MRKERVITFNVIKINNINHRIIAGFFARKYIEKEENVSKEKS